MKEVMLTGVDYTLLSIIADYVPFSFNCVYEFFGIYKDIKGDEKSTGIMYLEDEELTDVLNAIKIYQEFRADDTEMFGFQKLQQKFQRAKITEPHPEVD